MSKKYKIIVISAATTLALAIAAFFIGVYFPHSGSLTPAKSAANEDYAYLIKYESGEISVYDCENNELLYNLNIDPGILPEADLEKLEQGIYIKDKQSLRQMVEDLTG